jgi:hypothetical protein
VSLTPELSAARDEVRQTRAQLSDTIEEIEQVLTAPVRAVKHRLDVGRVIRNHPWAALTTAASLGAIVAASRTDRRMASLATEAARKSAEKVRDGGVAGARMAREAPSKSRTALTSIVDALGAKVAVSIIGALRSSDGRSAPDPHSGLGFVHHDAPAHESEQDPRPMP